MIEGACRVGIFFLKISNSYGAFRHYLKLESLAVNISNVDTTLVMEENDILVPG